jgi:hypothetical protein
MIERKTWGKLRTYRQSAVDVGAGPAQFLATISWNSKPPMISDKVTDKSDESGFCPSLRASQRVRWR